MMRGSERWQVERQIPGGRGFPVRPETGGRLDGAASRWGTGRYDGAFDGAFHGVLGAGDAVPETPSPYRWSQLAAHPPQRLELLARNHPGIDHRWFVSRLIEEVEQRLHRDAGEAETRELAALAVRLAADPGSRAETDHDLAARAWRARAEAQRRAGELAAAGESLVRVRHHLERGDGAPREEGLYHEARGRLLAARGHRRPAVLALRRAARLLRSVGESRLEGRVRVLAGLLLALHPEPRRSEALVELYEGLRRLGNDAEPDLARAGRCCLATLTRATLRPPLPAAAPPDGRAATRPSAPRRAAGSPPVR